MKDKQKLLQLKATLFDFNHKFTNKNIEMHEIIKAFNGKFTKFLNCKHSIMFIDEQELARLAPNRKDSLLKQYISTDIAYLNKLDQLYSKTNDNVLVKSSPLLLHGKSYSDYIIMKLSTATNFEGYYVLAYDTKPTKSRKLLVGTQQIINQHFEILCDYFYDQLIRKRNQTIFQLSANLHSVYNTIDVLKRVYRSITSLYPNFSYRFLMSHEHGDTSIPIFPMEYGNNHDFLGAKAFMNNTLQVEQKKKENQTIIYTPLTGRQGVYGVIEVTIPLLLHLNESDLDFMNQSSKMIGRAVERTTLYQSSTQLITDLQHINLASRDLNRNLEKAEISESVKKHITDSCHAEEIGIIFLSNGKESASKYTITEESTPYFKLSQAEDFVDYLYDKLRKSKEAILSGNFKIEGILIPFNSVMVIPMLDSEKMFGFIVIAHENPYYFSFDKYKFVQSFVQHASLAYANSMLKEKLRQTAITDYLTNLYMRNYLDEKIDQYMNQDQGGSFMLLDIDDFKDVNDTYGHYVGDKVLIQIAQILKRIIKDNEIAARWGGEEFAVYLPYCNEKYAQDVANQIRLHIKDGTEPNVTVSIGIATWCNDKHSIEELFIRADEALYKAKESGKNKIVMN